MLLVTITQEQAIVAYALSFVAIVTITIVYTLVVRKYGSFWDVIREKDLEASLARFQLLIWTWIVLFAFLGVFLARAFGGLVGIPEVPTNLMILMGVSVAPAVISSAYNSRYPPKARQVIAGKTVYPPMANMLMESMLVSVPGQAQPQQVMKPTVTRFQMFAWTFIAVTAYLVILFSTTASNLGSVENLSLPDVPQVLLILMGISQGAYVTGKFAKGT